MNSIFYDDDASSMFRVNQIYRFLWGFVSKWEAVKPMIQNNLISSQDVKDANNIKEEKSSKLKLSHIVDESHKAIISKKQMPAGFVNRNFSIQLVSLCLIFAPTCENRYPSYFLDLQEFK